MKNNNNYIMESLKYVQIKLKTFKWDIYATSNIIWIQTQVTISHLSAPVVGLKNMSLLMCN